MRKHRDAEMKKHIICYLLLVTACLVLCWFTLRYANEIDGLKKELSKTDSLRQELSLVNAHYDELYSDYQELLGVVAKEPWLKIEWELRTNPDQVRGVDGKLPHER